ncbi:MmcQ/YjbR family DNA-binding protein, partial [Bacillus toyonensis]|nr:MmcQ/YjbR family DNA-binding protein [Bacillus toyonensis]
VYIHKGVEQEQINKMVDWSYELVLQSFSKKKQQELMD